jgi:hypothetical protein
MMIELSIVQREKKIDIHKERIISSTNQARGSRGDRHRTKPEAGGEIAPYQAY